MGQIKFGHLKNALYGAMGEKFVVFEEVGRWGWGQSNAAGLQQRSCLGDYERYDYVQAFLFVSCCSYCPIAFHKESPTRCHVSARRSSVVPLGMRFE